MATFLRGAVRRFHTSLGRNSKSIVDYDPKHYEAGAKLWQKLSYFVAIPAVLVCMLNAYVGEKEHMEHYHRPEFIPYEHLRIRKKKFPWGDGNHTLFHNPKVNALPDGYETDE